MSTFNTYDLSICIPAESDQTTKLQMQHLIEGFAKASAKLGIYTLIVPSIWSDTVITTAT